MKTKRNQELDRTVPMAVPERSAQWNDGRLSIDGQTAAHIVDHGIQMGWIRRGVEVFKQDGRPISKIGRKKK